MNSIHTDSNFFEEDLLCKETKAFDQDRKCFSVQNRQMKSSRNSVMDCSGNSFDDIFSTSSGISGFIGMGDNPELHTSLVQRKRGNAICAEKNMFERDFKNLSQTFDDSCNDSFSLDVGIKKNIVALPSDPFKILDVPGIEDDYYTNLLSWSFQNKIAICLDNTVYLFDYKTSDITSFYEAFKLEKVTSLAFDIYGERLAIGNVLGQVAIWDVERKKELMSIDRHSDRVSCLDWSEKGLISGSKDKKAFLYDIRIRRHVASKFLSHTQEICGIKWNSTNTRFATGGNDNKALVWDIQSDKPLVTLKHKSGVKALCWATNQPDILITGGGYADRTLRSWNVSKDKLLFSRDTEAQVCALLYSPLTNDVISAKGGSDNDIEVWRSNGFKKVGNLSGHTERPLYLAWSPDNTVLLSVSSDETMRFWEMYKTKTTPNTKNYDEFSSYNEDE